jgi:hypothetical protein
MAAISLDEKLRRRRINESVIGTTAMEGISLDSETLALMRRYEDGDLSREELSSAIDEHVRQMLAARKKPVVEPFEAGVA